MFLKTPEFVCVITTVAGHDEAVGMARRIVEERLAACAQWHAIKSVYHWKGAVESGSEYLVTCKTTSRLSDKLQDFIRRNHKYDVPEIIVTPILDGHEPYLEWIAGETRG